MAVTTFTRFTNIRNVMNVNNISAVGGALSVKRHSDVKSKHYITDVTTKIEDHIIGEDKKKPEPELNKAMKLYLQKSKEYTNLIQMETIKYELGKRHLAIMMGEDPEQFQESDIKRAIKYLFPSGIYDWRAHPMLCHPLKIYENRKEAQFNETGRPYHWLFYTCKPQYYEILYNVAYNLKNLNEKQDKMINERMCAASTDKYDPLGSTWISKDELENKLTEELTIQDYEYFLKSMNRFIEHPLSAHNTEFIKSYRKEIPGVSDKLKLPPIQYDENGRPFVISDLCKRKTARAVVKVTDKGSGFITINGKDISYFSLVQDREQVSFYK